MTNTPSHDYDAKGHDNVTEKSKVRAHHFVVIIIGSLTGLRLFFLLNDDAHLFPSKVSTVSTMRSKALPYGERDSLHLGKTCAYQSSLWKLPFENRWTCQDCSTSGKCIPLKRRGKCRPYTRQDPDGPPRLATSHSPLTSSKSYTNVIRRHGRNNEELIQHEMPACSASLSLPCFDLSRCGRYSTIKIFPHGSLVSAYLDNAVRQIPHLIHKVNSPEDACLLVADPDSNPHPGALEHREGWNQGQNHYIFQSSGMGDNDKSFRPGMAAISDWYMDDASYREGYDTPLTPLLLSNSWIRPEKYDKLALLRPRRLLLTMTASILRWDHQSWQHQWIASEYWLSAPDVHVDAPCLSPGHTVKSQVKRHDEELLLNSTFWFIPGGSNNNNAETYSFSDILQGGAIPVVTADFLPPFSSEVDWKRCIIGVSEARVVDIPAIVRAIPKKEVRIRQRSCANLLENIFGNPPSTDQLFLFAMQLWVVRIQNALRIRADVEALTIETNMEFSY